jgi:hypothetical protein
MREQRNDCKNQQQVNQESSHMEEHKTTGPENQQKYRQT